MARAYSRRLDGTWEPARRCQRKSHTGAHTPEGESTDAAMQGSKRLSGVSPDSAPSRPGSAGDGCNSLLAGRGLSQRTASRRWRCARHRGRVAGVHRAGMSSIVLAVTRQRASLGGHTTVRRQASERRRDTHHAPARVLTVQAFPSGKRSSHHALSRDARRRKQSIVQAQVGDSDRRALTTRCHEA